MNDIRRFAVTMYVSLQLRKRQNPLYWVRSQFHQPLGGHANVADVPANEGDILGYVIESVRNNAGRYLKIDERLSHAQEVCVCCDEDCGKRKGGEDD